MQMSENEHFSTSGLALTEEERKSLEAEGFEFTGWYNQHGQPILRYTQTGKKYLFVG